MKKLVVVTTIGIAIGGGVGYGFFMLRTTIWSLADYPFHIVDALFIVAMALLFGAIAIAVKRGAFKCKSA